MSIFVNQKQEVLNGLFKSLKHVRITVMIFDKGILAYFSITGHSLQ